MTRVRTTGRLLIAAALMTSLWPLAASAATPRSTPEERAAALARPALVYVEVQWSGYVRDLSDGQLWVKEPLSFTMGCSGFAVNPGGYIVTAGHCVDPGTEGIAPTFFTEVVKQYADDGLIKEGHTPDDFFRQLRAGSVIEGEDAGTPPDRQVFVQRGVATSGLKSGQAFPARLVSFSKNSEGDVALLKVDQSDLPSITLAPSEPLEIGTPILAIGYPGSAEAVSDATFEPTNKDGKISAKRTVAGVPFYEISAATTHGMSGGPVVTLDGRVAGIVSFAPAAETQAFNFIAPAQLVRESLTRNGVENTLGRVDTLYRDGLSDYYAGRYDDAVESFDEVLGLVASHQQAQEYRQKAKAAIRSDGSGGGSPWPAVKGVATLILLLAIGRTAWQKRRGGGRGAAVIPIAASAAPLPEPPAMTIDSQARAGPMPTMPVPAPVPAMPVPVPVPAMPVPAPMPVSAPTAPVATQARPAEAGAAANEIACPSCGAGAPRGAHFCANCGGSL